MNSAESTPDATVTHDSKSTRQRAASKLFVVIWDTNIKQDNQVARDLPGEEHLHRQWQAAGKLVRTMSAPATGQKERAVSPAHFQALLPAQNSALSRHQWG